MSKKGWGVGDLNPWVSLFNRTQWVGYIVQMSSESSKHLKNGHTHAGKARMPTEIYTYKVAHHHMIGKERKITQSLETIR